MRGKFILFEGIDGSGKTTVSKAIADSLKAKNIPVLWHREPTDGKHGKDIRRFLKKEIQWTRDEQLDAFFKDRKDSVQTIIEPSLKTGVHIIQDRYFYSTAAYQGNDDFTPKSILEKSHASGFPIPDYIFFLEILPEEAKKRREARDTNQEAFDDLEIQKKIYQNYKSILPSSTILLDAKKTPEEILKDCLGYLKDLK